MLGKKGRGEQIICDHGISMLHADASDVACKVDIP